MGRFHRAQVLLEPAQYQQLKHLARARSLQQGRRVSISQIIRELLDQALAQETEQERQARAALQALFGLGDVVQTRHPQPLPEDWLVRDREEHDDARASDLLAGR